MTREQRKAHERMLATLPVRTHLRKDGPMPGRQGISMGAVRYEGRTYSSMSELRRVRRISYQRARELLVAGLVRYV